MEYISDFERAYGISQEPWGLATNELVQAEETGNDVAALRARYAELSLTDDDKLTRIYDELPKTPAGGWPHFEGSDLDAIVAELGDPGAVTPIARAELDNRVKGAWFGRIAGNMLGKPVEFGFPRATLKSYLDAKGAYPLTDFVPIDEATAAADGFAMWEGLSRGEVVSGVRDDDVDYTVLGLHLLETYGTGFTARDVAFEWLSRFPAYQVYTAERATYQNLVREVPFEQVGEFHNPYREWIGAQIRADIFGYVSPGAPRRAALLAYKDAILSHRANGIYGEMWAAALIATAFTAESPEASIVASLAHVPPTSRLAIEVLAVLDDYRAGLSWEQTMDKLDARYPTMSWVHTLNNTGAITAGILWGEGDYTSTIAHTVQAGLDTDSTGATAGSWAGAFLGFDAIPSRWVEPLNDRTVSALFGYGEVSISDLAARTVALIRGTK